MMEWVRLSVSAVLLFSGLLIFVAAAVGVNKFKRALNRMHAAALGDTLGILFMTLGLVVWKGISFASLKLLLVVLFFWLASPVAGHMISRLEAMTDESLGEISVLEKNNGIRIQVEDQTSSLRDVPDKKRKKKKGGKGR